MSEFIVKGRLPDEDVEILVRDMVQYSKDTIRGEVTNEREKTHGYESDLRDCDIHFVHPSCFPNTAMILHSLLIEGYNNIYPDLDYTNISDFQYVRYSKGQFFRKHNDVIRNNDGLDHFRHLTMSINMSDEDDYVGGDLVVYDKSDNEIGRMDRAKGSYMIIPAFFVHEAHLVESGTREAIVTWLSGTNKTLSSFRAHVGDK